VSQWRVEGQRSSPFTISRRDRGNRLRLHRLLQDKWPFKIHYEFDKIANL